MIIKKIIKTTNYFVIAALVAMFGLSACGNKGPLYTVQPSQTQTPPSTYAK